MTEDCGRTKVMGSDIIILEEHPRELVFIISIIIH